MKKILIIGNGILGQFTKKYLSQVDKSSKKSESTKYLFFDTDARKSDLTLEERNCLLPIVDEVYYCASFYPDSYLDNVAADIKTIRYLLRSRSILILRTTLPVVISESQDHFDAYWPALEKEKILTDKSAKVKNASQLIGLSKGVVTLSDLFDRVNFEHVTTLETALTAKIAVNNSIVKTSAMIQTYLDSADTLDKDLITSLIFKKLRSLDFVTPYIGGTCLNKDLQFSSVSNNRHYPVYLELARVQDEAVENTKTEVYNFLRNKTNFVLILKGVINHENDTSWHKNNFLQRLVVQLSSIKKPKYLIVSDVVDPNVVQEATLVKTNYRLANARVTTIKICVEEICANKKNSIIEIEFQPNANTISNWISLKLKGQDETLENTITNRLNIKLYSSLR